MPACMVPLFTWSGPSGYMRPPRSLPEKKNQQGRSVAVLHCFWNKKKMVSFNAMEVLSNPLFTGVILKIAKLSNRSKRGINPTYSPGSAEKNVFSKQKIPFFIKAFQISTF